LSNLGPTTPLPYRRMDRLKFDIETSFFDTIFRCLPVDHGSHCPEARTFAWSHLQVRSSWSSQIRQSSRPPFRNSMEGSATRDVIGKPHARNVNEPVVYRNRVWHRLAPSSRRTRIRSLPPPQFLHGCQHENDHWYQNNQRLPPVLASRAAPVS
jgi:hypothetical protein